MSTRSPDGPRVPLLPSSTRRQAVIACASLAALAAICLTPSLLRDRVSAAAGGLGAAEPALLWAAGAAFATMSLCSALAWRAALRASGSPLTVADASSRYLVGCGLNAVAPAHVGSAVRIALLGRVTHGGCWVVSGAAAAVGAIRFVWLGVLVAIAAGSGALPALPLLLIAAVVGAAVVAAAVSARVSLPRRAQRLLASFRALATSPRDLAIVAGWTLAGSVAKVAASAAVVAALGVDRPLRAALVLVPALQVTAFLPVTPGNVGLTSAGVALALGTQGVDPGTALSAGIAFSAAELLTGMVVGLAGALALAGPTARPYLRVAAAGAAAGVVTVAFGATVVLPVV